MLCTLMNKKLPVAELIIDEKTTDIHFVTSCSHPAYLPVGIPLDSKGLPFVKDLNNWWQNRLIPISLKYLHNKLIEKQIPNFEPFLVKSYGLSLSDQYWINPYGEQMDWEEINLFDHAFSDSIGMDSLNKRLSKAANSAFIMPQFNGKDRWIQKKWKIIDDKRYLFKSGSVPLQQEPLNEVFAVKLHKRLGFTLFADYKLHWERRIPYSVCENFITTETELVNAFGITNVLERKKYITEYQHFMDCCEYLEIPNMKEYIDYLIIFDYIIANTDRHYGNIGMIRNCDTLKWLGPSPIFDSGTSLWHDKGTSDIQIAADVICHPFESTHSKQIKLTKGLDRIDFKSLNNIEDALYETHSSSHFMNEARMDMLCKGIRRRIRYLESI